MKSIYRTVLAGLGLSIVMGSSSSAQPLPEGHPPIAAVPEGNPAAADQPVPEGHPPIDDTPAAPATSAEALPPGHPPVAGMGGAPSGGAASALPRDLIQEDLSLPTGAVRIEVLNAEGRAIAGGSVALNIKHQTVATGERRSERRSALDPAGTAVFDNLAGGSEWTYSASIEHAGVPYASQPFQLRARGLRVVMHVFDATEDMDGPPIGAQVFVVMEPRDEVLQIEQLIRLVNVGKKTWRVSDLFIPLPPKSKAFSEASAESTVRTRSVEGGYSLSGFVPPGQTEVIVRWQIPYGGETLGFDLSMPPRVAHLQLVGAMVEPMSFRTQGSSPPMETRGRQGERLLISQTMVAPGGDQVERTSITVEGVPTQGSGRWIALSIAVTAMFAGIAVAARRPKNERSAEALEQEMIDAAKRTVLAEVAELERARRAGDVGPKNYARLREELTTQLARLLVKPGA